jgi:hypothetical protein
MSTITLLLVWGFLGLDLKWKGQQVVFFDLTPLIERKRLQKWLVFLIALAVVLMTLDVLATVSIKFIKYCL